MQNIKIDSKDNVVCFIGISGKPGTGGTLEALSDKTLSGKIISTVETKLRAVPECSVFFRDNLVKNPPLTNGKLRYPTSKEMKSEWRSFEKRLVKTRSNVVILLGALVADFFQEKRKIRMVNCGAVDGLLLKWAGVDDTGLFVLAIAHPSYVGVYARKRISDYVEMIYRAIQGYLKSNSIEFSN